jgi:PPK2 family polyphosphate:nucleotide phosphotransferase
MDGKTLKRWRIDRRMKLDLAEFDPAARPLSSGPRPADHERSKEADKARIATLAQRLAQLQDRFYALRRNKLLLVLQGMDTSGKDGTIRTVFQAIDPMGVRAVSYRAPTPPEKEHDFLWRHHRDVPGLGEIVIFNRSHYESVLIEWVHGWIDDAERRSRLAHIRSFEDLLVGTGTTIVKCFLHIGRDEQRRRLQERIDDPDKNWKFNPQDLEERKLWKRYQQAYAKALGETATRTAPWYVIPANSKTHRSLMVLEILLHALAPLAAAYPPGDPALKGTIVV